MLTKEELLQIVDGDYAGISEMLKRVSHNEIMSNAAELFEVEQAYIEQASVGLFSKSTNKDTYFDAVVDMIRNVKKYDWVYEHLADIESKEVFTNLVRYRLLPDKEFLIMAASKGNIPLDCEKVMECAGAQAVIGAKEYIENFYPRLAISMDNFVSDLWELPMLLHMIREDYRYYLRHVQSGNSKGTVLYALPVNPVKTKQKQIHRVVAMAPYERPWSNVELIKDCGLIPYLLYKNHGCDVSMVGAKGGEYPYAELVKGMKLKFLENGNVATKHKYIYENGKDIDCLILRGCYPSNFGVAKIYKMVNPNGKIYVGLDANSHWMDRILWYQPDFVDFMDHCDVIATSCTAMQKHLNEK